MAVPNDKSRLMVTLPHRIKSDFECICELEKRTSSKQLEYILEYYIQNIEKRISIEDYDNYYKNVYLKNQLADKITAFLTRKTGQYKGKDISVEYFYEVFKNESIDDEVIKKVVDNLVRMEIPMNEFLLKCIEYHTKQKD